MSAVSANRKSKIQNPRLEEFSVAWDPRFLEEAVLRAAETRQVLGFRGQRNRLYEIQDPEQRWVGIRLDPHRLLDEEGLLAFLRHELFHIADMLDAAFGYEPRLPRGETGPTHERLLQDRYRVLWDIYIDGRLVHRNWAPSSVRDRRLEEFIRTFPMLADRVEEAFSRFFDSTPLTH